MKKISVLLSLALTLACLTACFAGMTLTSSAEAEFEMTIPYGKPTLDGRIEDGEYAVTYVMDRTTATAWVGEVGSSKVTWHLAWDEGGLYYAGTINDRTPAYGSKNAHWVGLDCLELAVNPGLLLEGDVAEGIFFSCGSAEDGSLVVYRHNFADGLVSDQITGANQGHTKKSTSYTMEVYLPWSLMQIDEDCTVGGKGDIHLDSTGWEPRVGAVLGLLPCAIDSLTENGSDIIAYKFNGTDFVVCDFVVATLADAEGNIPPAGTEAPIEVPDEVPTTAPTEAVTSGETEPVHDAPSDTSNSHSDSERESTPEPETQEAKGGCAGIVTLCSATLLASAACVLLRKKEE